MENRPIFLNLFALQYPVMGIVSFSHRVSGVILCFFIPAYLWCMQESLASEARFNQLIQILEMPLAKITILLFSLAFLFHFIAGIRHLLMDAEVGESKRDGRISAYL